MYELCLDLMAEVVLAGKYKISTLVNLFINSRHILWPPYKKSGVKKAYKLKKVQVIVGQILIESSLYSFNIAI